MVKSTYKYNEYTRFVVVIKTVDFIIQLNYLFLSGLDESKSYEERFPKYSYMFLKGSKLKIFQIRVKLKQVT